MGVVLGVGVGELVIVAVEEDGFEVGDELGVAVAVGMGLGVGWGPIAG